MRPRGHYLGQSDPSEYNGTTTPQTTASGAMPGADPTGITTKATVPGFDLNKPILGIPTWVWVGAVVAYLLMSKKG